MKVVVLASGSGTLLQAVIDALGPGSGVELAAVGSDRECAALERAAAVGIEHFVVPYVPKNTDRSEWNRELANKIASFNPDLVVSAGFMRILGEELVRQFEGRIINTHPALLPAFPGAHAVRDALNYGVKVTGTTVHVVDSGVDSGPILAQEAVAVEPGDTEDTLHERIKTVERALLVITIRGIAENGITINGRKAWTTSNDC